MLVLFMAGYWSGFVLITRAYEAEGGKIAACTFAAGLFPIALNFNGQLVKDVSMAICLLLTAAIPAALIHGAIKKRAATVGARWLFLVMDGFIQPNALSPLPALLD